MLVVQKYPDNRLVHATPPIVGTPNPKWDPMSLSLEVLLPGYAEGSDQFTLQVWDYDSGGQHSVIGSCLVSLADVLTSQTVSLKDPDSPTDFVGSLELSGGVVSEPDEWHTPKEWASMVGRDSALLHNLSTTVTKPLPGLAGLIGVGTMGGAHAPSDPSPSVRVEAIEALVKLGTRGDERLLDALLAATVDSDSLVRKTALRAVSQMSWACDERVVSTLCSSSQQVPFLDRVNVPGASSDWPEVREVAVQCLESHFSLGWGCVQVCEGPEVIGAVVEQAKDIRNYIGSVVKELADFKVEIAEFEARGERREIARLMHKMLHHKSMMEDVVLQERNCLHWLVTEWMQAQGCDFPLRCISFNLLLAQSGMLNSEAYWHPPLAIPAPLERQGRCTLALKRFPHLDRSTIMGRHDVKAAAEACARDRIEKELKGRGHCRFKAQGWGMFATRRPPCLVASGGTWRGAGDDSISGEAVVTSLWFPPLAFPRRRTRRGTQQASFNIGSSPGHGPPDSTLAWRSSEAGQCRISNQRYISGRIAVIRCDLSDVGLVSEVVARLVESKAIAIIIIGSSDCLIPPPVSCRALDDCLVPVLCLSPAQGTSIIDGAWLDVGVPVDDEPLSALQNALDDPSRGVRSAACRVLARVGAIWGVHTPSPGLDLVTGQVDVVSRPDGSGTVLPLRTRGNGNIVRLLAELLVSFFQYPSDAPVAQSLDCQCLVIVSG